MYIRCEEQSDDALMERINGGYDKFYDTTVFCFASNTSQRQCEQRLLALCTFCNSHKSLHSSQLEASTLPSNSVVGVCHPKNVAEYERSGAAASISGGSVAGFLHLVGVEEGDKDGAAKMTFTSPVEGALPSSMVITGEGVAWLNG